MKKDPYRYEQAKQRRQERKKIEPETNFIIEDLKTGLIIALIIVTTIILIILLYTCSQ